MNNTEIDKLFKSIDLNNKGYIIIDDIRDNDLMPEEVFHQIDVNKDGRITLEEFKHCFNQYYPDDEHGEKNSDFSITSQSDKLLNGREYEEDFYSYTSNEEEEEDFQNMIQSLNAEKIMNHVPNIRFLWQHLRKKPEENEKLREFEEFLSKLAEDKKNSEFENSNLKNALLNEKAYYENLINQLTVETESQISMVKSGVVYQENLRLKKMQSELEEKTLELQDAIDKQIELEKQLAESDKAKKLEEKLEIELEEKNRELQDAIDKQTELEKELAFERQNSIRFKRVLSFTYSTNTLNKLTSDDLIADKAFQTPTNTKLESEKDLEYVAKRAELETGLTSEEILFERKKILEELKELKNIIRTLQDEKDERDAKQLSNRQISNRLSTPISAFVSTPVSKRDSYMDTYFSNFNNDNDTSNEIEDQLNSSLSKQAKLEESLKVIETKMKITEDDENNLEDKIENLNENNILQNENFIQDETERDSIGIPMVNLELSDLIEKQLTETVQSNKLTINNLELDKKNVQLDEVIAKKTELEKQLEIERQNSMRLKRNFTSEDILFEKNKILEELNELKNIIQIHPDEKISESPRKKFSTKRESFRDKYFSSFDDADNSNEIEKQLNSLIDSLSNPIILEESLENIDNKLKETETISEESIASQNSAKESLEKINNKLKETETIYEENVASQKPAKETKQPGGNESKTKKNSQVTEIVEPKAALKQNQNESESQLDRVFSLNKSKQSFKVIFLGDCGVGKTCFIRRITRNKFEDSLPTTVGIDYESKTISVDGKVAILRLWDTAGQEKYRSIVKTYYRDSDCFICMYDITSEESFLNLRNWITSIRETAYNSKLKIVIIGNKLDLVREEIPRGVERRDAETLAKENDALYFEVSTKTCFNVFEAVAIITRSLFEEVNFETEINSGFKPDEKIPNKKKCCN